MEKEIMQGCPICSSQGKMIIMEGNEGDNNVICAVHGLISVKYFHDIFLDPSWIDYISSAQRRDNPRRALSKRKKPRRCTASG